MRHILRMNRASKLELLLAMTDFLSVMQTVPKFQLEILKFNNEMVYVLGLRFL